jgi:nucleoside-diphosphate-sugar epimerase
MPAKRRFLVTGASGFIGKHAVAELLDQGHDVIAISRSGRHADGRVSTLRCDLLAEADFGPVIQAANADTLLHLAWETRHGYYWDAPENLDWLATSVRLIKAFHEAGGRRVVVAGTCAEYQAPPDGVCDALSTPCSPRHLYSASKDGLRRVGEIYARKVGLSFAWVRLFHLTGPGEFESRLVPTAIRAFTEGRMFETKNADKRLDIMDVRDCGRGFAAIGASDVEGPINIGSGVLVPIAEIVRELAVLLGRPDLLALKSAPGRRDELPDCCAELATLHDVLAFRPFYTLREALLAAIASGSHLAKQQDRQ